MNGNAEIGGNKRNIWIRGIFMLLMLLVYHVCGAVLCIVSVFQFAMQLLNDTPNVRLVAFGRSLGRYLQQIANFMAFATKEIPFPFSDWPAVE